MAKIIIATSGSENTGSYTNEGYDNSGDYTWYQETYSCYIDVQYAYEDTETTEHGYSMYRKCKLVVTEGHSNPKLGSLLVDCYWLADSITITSEGEYGATDWVKIGEVSYENSSYTFGHNYVSHGQTVITAEFCEWKDIPHPIFNVIYDCTGGTGGPSNDTYEWWGHEHHPCYISTSEPTKSGNVFLGWTTDETAETADYSSGDSFYPNYEDITLYAVWRSTEPQDVYIENNIIYAKSFTVEEGLQTVEIDTEGNVYAAAFIEDDTFSMHSGNLYAVAFIEGEPES